MPPSDMHRQKRGKNLFTLVALLLFVAAMFYLTILKISGA